MREKMRAVVCTAYGEPEVLQVKQRPLPRHNSKQMLVEIKASAVTASDIYIRSSLVDKKVMIPFRLMIGIFKPRRKVIGMVFSGVVRSVGSNIRRFQPGDEVYGMTGFKLGTYAEFAVMKETDSTIGCVARKPENLSHEEATSAVYGGALALQSLERGEIKEGQDVLIYGASGTSGTIAVQYAKSKGARVTAVCGPDNQDFVKSLGADRVWDYTKEDKVPQGEKFDFVVDSVGGTKKSPLKESCFQSLKEEGITAGIDDDSLELNSRRINRLNEMIEEGLIKPVVDRTYSLEEIVEAHRYVELGHKRGGVAIKIRD